MPYNYRAPTLEPPTPDQVRDARLSIGMTQAAAAALVHCEDSARWRAWERPGPSGRKISLAAWELFLIKTGLRVYP